jgi:sn-glycerol 3-phosphate transport system permease protein
MSAVGRTRRTREALLAYALLLPSLAIFAAFAYYPFYRIIHFALYQKYGNSDRESFVGVKGVFEVLGSSEFTSGLWTTVKFMLYTVPAGLLIGVLLATAAHRRLRGIKIFQTIFSSTIASSVAVSSVVFLTLVNKQAGYFQNVKWLDLETPGGAMRGIALSSIWQNVGLTFIIVLAGLQAIPDEIVEAAMLDGHGPVRRFFRITIPLISPTLMFLAVVLVVHALQTYAPIELLTNGGPNRSTENLLFKIVQLQGRTDLQTGASMALGLFVFTLVVSALQFVMLDKRVHYES